MMILARIAEHGSIENQTSGRSDKRYLATFLPYVLPLALIAFATAGLADEAPNGDTAPGPDTGQKEFKEAGACARCHVVSVLEWGISGHRIAATTCQSCHGRSAGHVANERNEIKPQRLPRGANIAGQLCLTCHKKGCPETQKVQTCQQCHHVHALIHPTQKPAAHSERTNDMLRRWDGFKAHMAKGRHHVEQQDWISAQAAFESALKLVPGDRRARSQWHMCRRRIDPAMPGFQIIGDKVDSATGLPSDVKVRGFDIELGLVVPGAFDMGSDAFSDSQPVHTVRVEAFYLGRFEVTQAEWRAVMGTNPARHQGESFPESGRMPVEQVSWDDCIQFIRRLNGRVTGGGFRLPTEAEWEYACRAGGDQKLRPDEVAESAWYRPHSRRQAEPEGEFFELDAFSPRPVGTRRPNRRGFFDMKGNVGEWCSSLWRPYGYDGRDGRESPVQTGLRVVRGGSFGDSAAGLDPTLRHAERPKRRLRFNGLRLARNVPALDDLDHSKGSR